MLARSLVLRWTSTAEIGSRSNQLSTLSKLVWATERKLKSKHKKRWPRPPFPQQGLVKLSDFKQACSAHAAANTHSDHDIPRAATLTF